MATPEAGSVPEATPPPRTGSADELLDICAICLGSMPREEEQEQVASESGEASASCQLLECGHRFHAECVGTWLKGEANLQPGALCIARRGCPLCRAVSTDRSRPLLRLPASAVRVDGATSLANDVLTQAEELQRALRDSRRWRQELAFHVADSRDRWGDWRQRDDEEAMLAQAQRVLVRPEIATRHPSGATAHHAFQVRVQADRVALERAGSETEDQLQVHTKPLAWVLLLMGIIFAVAMIARSVAERSGR